MAKRQIQFTKTCSDCIHESACRIWTDGRFISDTSASVCPNHETVKESGAYLCGVLDERKRKKTNADKIRAMSDEDFAAVLRIFCIGMADCEDCPLYRFGCPKSSAFNDWIKWLQQLAEVDHEDRVG